MDKDELFNIHIDRPDKSIYDEAKRKWDLLSKPLDGLGSFEGLICRLAAMQKSPDIDISKRAAVIMIADNGIVEEGISQSGSEVTRAVGDALIKGISSANTLGRYAKTDIISVDVGIAGEVSADAGNNMVSALRNKDINNGKREPLVTKDGLFYDKKVAFGTKNFLKEPAMSEQETLKAIIYGIEVAYDLKEKGYKLLITGEMGIGNTTTSAAVLCSLLGLDAEVITGRGAGLSDAALKRKKEVIKIGIKKYCTDNEKYLHLKNDKERVFYILSCLGGLDIAALAGVFIGAAMNRLPVLIDGLISSVAALIAERMVVGVKEYYIASHKGREGGHAAALKELGLKAFIDADMALGEGTGGIMALPLIDMVLDFYNNASVFKDIKVNEYERLS